MSEIKFACPTCNQHIACDVTYADMMIICPACGGPMVVPILSAACAAHPDLVLVAALPAPRQKFHSRVPSSEPWTEKKWDKHFTETTGEKPNHVPRWAVCSLGTIILTALLVAFQAGTVAVIVAVVVGTILSAFLVAKDRPPAAEVGALAGVMGTAVATMFLLVISLPIIGFTVVFIGCTGGCR